MAGDPNPLIDALPPKSDYLTYLTIVEYNLTPENLPVLHRVLQDEKLTTNIGWDLVHLLVPHLPDSEQCLQDIARLGNPREVILKVTESLRLIEYEDPEEAEDQDEEPEDAIAGAADSRARAESSTYPTKTAPTKGSDKQPGTAQMMELPPPIPLAVNQFIALLSMLTILQPRIKTKYPSRFLSTSLQAILASFSKATTHREEMVQAIVSLIKTACGVQRPTLPSRKSSGMLNSVPTVAAKTPAADPEGSSNIEVTSEERAIERKLISAFVTHVIEEYLLELPSDEDIPGLAWCSRLMEKMHPERIIPEKPTFGERFQNEGKLHRRIDAVGQLVTLAKDLKISDDALLSAATVEENVPATLPDEDEPPASADDIPLSRTGSLMLYTARQASAILYDKYHPSAGEPFAIFPNHQELMRQCLSSPAHGTGTLGTEPESLIDTVLALGLVCLERNNIGEPSSDDQFTEYLQVTALLSSNCPSPNLRGHAHYLTSTILRSQPDEDVRLAFIRDTLENCPFENLKTCAVGWIKGEVIEANPPSGSTEDSIFATPLALDTLAPYLFPSLEADLLTAPLPQAWQTFQTNLSFYLASLNFVYLLLCAKHLHENLGVADLWKNTDVAGSFLQPLRDARERFGKEMAAGGQLADEGVSAGDLALVDAAVERVTGAVSSLNDA